MRIRVLGAAAGGGFPQWNAGDEANALARAGDGRAPRATQASIAVSSDGVRWAVVNASPDIRTQIDATPALHPRTPRGTPIAAVVLTNGDVDAIAGLLSLREGTPFALYAPAAVHSVLDASPVFEVVNRALVPRRTLQPEAWQDIADASGAAIGVAVRPFAVPGKVPLFLETDARPEAAPEASDEATVGLEIAAGGASLFYLANVARMDPALSDRLRGAAFVFFDGTLFRDDEMIAAGVGKKTAGRMGHMAMAGPGGAMAALRDLGIGRVVFIHINNTNPVLLDGSPERAQVEAAGFAIARDGMEFSL